MRKILVPALLGLFTLGLHAAMITPEEQKVQQEFTKAYNNPDKTARIAAMSMLEGAKHSSSWSLLAGKATGDPDAEVRLAAFTILAKEPARDTSLARMLAGIYSNIKFNDYDARLAHAKALAPVQFKADVTMAVGTDLTKMRYPDIPRLIQQQTASGSTDNRRQIEAAKKARTEYEGLLEAFNAFAGSELKSPTKETPMTMKKWLDENLPKMAKEDRDLAEKNRKEDAEAEKKAKEAAAKK